MSKRKDYEVIRENEFGYLKAGDYLIPTIKLHLVEEKTLNKYGRMRKVILQEQNLILFDDLMLTKL